MNDEQRQTIQQIASMANDKNTKYRLGWGAISILMAAAGFADLISLIPFAGDFVSPIYWFCVAGFLYLKGFGLMNPGRLATQLVGFAAELIPGVQEFPVFLLATALLIILTRVEDKTGIKANLSGRNWNDPATMNRNGVRLPSGQNQPLNSGGVRNPSPQIGDQGTAMGYASSGSSGNVPDTNTAPALGEEEPGEEMGGGKNAELRGQLERVYQDGVSKGNRPGFRAENVANSHGMKESDFKLSKAAFGLKDGKEHERDVNRGGLQDRYDYFRGQGWTPEQLENDVDISAEKLNS